MKRAVVLLLALCVLAPPAAVQAQEMAFTTAATAAFRGIGEELLTRCKDRRDARPVKVGIAEMESASQYTLAKAQAITDGVATALNADARRGGFVVIEGRLRAHLKEIGQELGGRVSPQIGGIAYDWLIAIEPTVDGRVNVVAFNAGDHCRGPERSIAVGSIPDVFDDPEAFFAQAAQMLEKQQMEAMVVMKPDIDMSLGSGVSAVTVVERWRNMLFDAIGRTFYNSGHRRLTGGIPPVERYGGGTPAAGAWQARLHVSRLAHPRGIEARVAFSGPGSSLPEAHGRFPPDAVPPASDPLVLQVRAAKSPFTVGDAFDVRIKVLRPSRLFCFMLDQDGEAALLYPTSVTEAERVFYPGDGELQFPRHFNMSGIPRLRSPIDEYFHCVATRYPLPDTPRERWFRNTAARRVAAGERSSIDTVATREILSGLQQSEGYAEAHTEIRSVQPR
jgi:hypothetical protein